MILLADMQDNESVATDIKSQSAGHVTGHRLQDVIRPNHRSITDYIDLRVS